MSRIATLASSEHLLDMVSRTQRRVLDLQAQVSTGKRSQSYAGMAADSRALLDLEHRRSMLDRFQHNNDMMAVRLDVTEATIGAVHETIRQFRQQVLTTLSNGDPLDAQEAGDLQQAAFRAMKNMQDFLNTDVDGRYLFAGSRVSTPPMELGVSTIEEFQAIYDGDSVLYPRTAASQVGHRGVFDPALTGGLTMNAGAGTITTASPTVANVFGQLRKGMTITIEGSGAGNDGAYTIVAVDTATNTLTIDGTFTEGSTTMTVNGSVNAEVAVAATLSVVNWYHGDTQAKTHRVDDDRSFELVLDAVDPAFEKAMRAFGVIAEGAVGTTGGLDAHPQRVDQALALLNAALDRITDGTEPFGTETAGSMEEIATELGFQQVLLEETREIHRHLGGLLDSRIAKLENVDEAESIAMLLDNTRALEASYQALARVRQLSLSQFLG